MNRRILLTPALVALLMVQSISLLAAEPVAPATSENIFTLGTPQCIQEKGSKGTYIVIVPVEAKKPDQFEEPGLKLAYVFFDKEVKSPPDDLETDETSMVLNTGLDGQNDLVWQVRSAKQEVGGEAHFFMGAPKYKAVGTHGVLMLGLNGDLPDKTIGLFVMDEMKPCSNVVVFRKKDFAEGNGEKSFEAASAKIPAADSPAGGQK